MSSCSCRSEADVLNPSSWVPTIWLAAIKDENYIFFINFLGYIKTHFVIHSRLHSPDSSPPNKKNIKVAIKSLLISQPPVSPPPSYLLIHHGQIIQCTKFFGQVQSACHPHDGYNLLTSCTWLTFSLAFAAFGGILFGYDTGTISGIIAMPAWLGIYGTPGPGGIVAPGNPNGYILDSSRTSLVVSILSAGTFFGALLAYPVGDMIGRK